MKPDQYRGISRAILLLGAWVFAATLLFGG
jgi:hypothetical protein